MIKILLITFILALSSNLNARTVREYEYIKDEQRAYITFNDDIDAISSVFNDGAENVIFIQSLFTDYKTKLYINARNIELLICGFSSLSFEWIEGCGQIYVTETIESHFIRDGNHFSEAKYLFILAFVNEVESAELTPYYYGIIKETVIIDNSKEKNVNKILKLESMIKI